MSQIKDLELIQNKNILFTHKIVIYGAGNYGKKAVKLLEESCISVFCICDSNSEQWGGKMLDGKYNIISPMELKQLSVDNSIAVIIAINSVKSVEQVLKILDYCGMEDMDCYTYFSLKYLLLFSGYEPETMELVKKKRNYLNEIALEWLSLDQLKLSRFRAIYGLAETECVLVYQPSKVGSLTVQTSLAKAGINSLHIHFLNGGWMSALGMNEVVSNPHELQVAVELFRSFKKVKIISLVREPIGRDISQFFQIFDNNAKTKYYQSDFLQGIVKQIDEYSKFGEFGYQFEWFNQEIKTIFGVDIYLHEFNKQLGYQIIQEKNVELLIMKMEKLNQCEKIIGDFTGIEQFKLERVNSSDHKEYHFVYDEVKTQVQIPREMAERYYKNNSAMDHFYTEEEKELFLSYWKNNLID